MRVFSIIHFAFFIIGCYEVNLRNRLAVSPRIIIVKESNGVLMTLGPESVDYQQLAQDIIRQKRLSEQQISLYGAPPYDEMPAPPSVVYAGSKKGSD